jgi:hypothetical protein
VNCRGGRRFVVYNLSTAHHDAAGVAAALSRHRTNVAAVLTANGE